MQSYWQPLFCITVCVCVCPYSFTNTCWAAHLVHVGYNQLVSWYFLSANKKTKQSTVVHTNLKNTLIYCCWKRHNLFLYVLDERLCCSGMLQYKSIKWTEQRQYGHNPVRRMATRLPINLSHQSWTEVMNSSISSSYASERSRLRRSPM